MNKKLVLMLSLCLLGLVGCNNKDNNSDVVAKPDVTVESHEESKLEQSGEIVNKDESDEPKTDAIVDVYEGNFFENEFLNIGFRYPENWFSTDNYDVILNTMKSLELNDNLDLTKVKLPNILPIVTFSCNDTYNNTIDILATSSLDSLVQKAEDQEPIIIDGNGKKDKESDTKKEGDDKKESKPNDIVVGEIKPFTPEDLAKIKKNVAESQTASGFKVISSDEPYIEKYGEVEVASIETISQLYGIDYQVLTSFIDIGENYLMLITCSTNEPNDVDKIANLEDIVSTLKVGVVEEVEDPNATTADAEKDTDVEKDSTETTGEDKPVSNEDTTESEEKTNN